MTRKTFFTALLLVFCIMLTAVILPVSASDQGQISGKSEVIFGQLTAEGSVNDLYAVNHFTLKEARSFKDYGRYDSVARLVEGSEVTLDGDEVSISAEAGRFFYQGNLSDNRLPWSFKVKYKLDGKPVTPAELAGASGRLGLEIEIAEGDLEFKSFYDHFLLQLTVSLPFAKAENIVSENGATALEGDATLVNFMAFPKQSMEMKLEADVHDFTMPGIRIAAIPLHFDVDFETLMEGMEGREDLSFDKLTDAIKQLSDGGDELVEPQEDLLGGMADLRSGLKDLTVGGTKLKDGAEELGDGLTELADGIKAYGDGVSKVADGGDALVEGARALADGLDALYYASYDLETGASDLTAGLNDLSFALTNIQLPDIPELPENFAADLQDLVDGSAAVKQALEELDTGLATLVDVFTNQDNPDGLKAPGEQLLLAAAAFPTELIEEDTAEEWMAKFQLDPTNPRDQMIAGTLAQLSQGVNGAVTFSAGVTGYINGVSTAAGGLIPLSTGLSDLSDNYDLIDTGIGAIAAELSQLSFDDLEDFDLTPLTAGVSALATGMSDFETGLSTYLSGLRAAAIGMSSENLETPGLLQGLEAFVSGIDTLAESSDELSNGVKAAGDGVTEFADGITKYVDGVRALRRGHVQFTDGLSEYLDGVKQLAEGLNEFKDETDDLDETFMATIEEELKEMLGGDFVASSFVSGKNSGVETVQFVFMTEAIEKQ